MNFPTSLTSKKKKNFISSTYSFLGFSLIVHDIDATASICVKLLLIAFYNACRIDYFNRKSFSFCYCSHWQWIWMITGSVWGTNNQTENWKAKCINRNFFVLNWWIHFTYTKRLCVEQFIDSQMEILVGRLNIVSIKMHIFQFPFRHRLPHLFLIVLTLAICFSISMALCSSQFSSSILWTTIRDLVAQDIYGKLFDSSDLLWTRNFAFYSSLLFHSIWLPVLPVFLVLLLLSISP